jgi:large subunit ribosomal protein L16
MLSPKKSKFRKAQKGRNRGIAWRGCHVAFGDYGLMATEHGHLSARQIEAGRMAVQRHCKRAGKLWIRIFPDRPVTKKPLEVRMGGGKGAPESWACPVQPGRIIFELAGVTEDVAKEAFRIAAHKLSVATRFARREGSL